MNNFIGVYFKTGVSKRSTVALLCYFLSRWCYFSFLVMKGAARRATTKSSLDTPVKANLRLAAMHDSRIRRLHVHFPEYLDC